MNEEYKPVLKQEGLLTRDARIKERKNMVKRARKRFQFSKDNFSKLLQEFQTCDINTNFKTRLF